MRRIEVWDLPTRVFHWTLVALVVFDLLVAEDEGWVLVLHSYAGYLVLLLLLFRLAWGFVGGEHARFSDFLSSPSTVRAYTARFIALDPPAYVGHNPLAGWMAVVMLATLLVVAVTGVAALGEDGGASPLAPIVSPALADVLGEIHEGAADFLIFLIVVHVIGAVTSSLVHRENLIGAMITGRKRVAESSPARDARAVAGWRAMVLAVALAFLAGWLVANTQFAGRGEGFENEAQEEETQEEETGDEETGDEDHTGDARGNGDART